MAIQAPLILLPSGGVDYSTDTPVQTISGTTASNTDKILVDDSESGVSYTQGETVWSWTGTLDLGVNAISVVARERTTGLLSSAATINITYVIESSFVTVAAPTGVSLKRYQDKIEVVTSKNTEANVIGYNFYVSYQSGGVNNEYVKMNPQLVTKESFYEETITVTGTTQNTVGQIRITTTLEEIIKNYFYSYFFDKTMYTNFVEQGLIPDVGFTQDVSFFFVITATIYDPLLGQVTESSYSPELEGSPITITTGIQDLPARTQSDIILTYTQELLTANPGIDLKPGTVIRDQLDPVSEEQARTYVIQDFLSKALSVSTLQDFDDADGDGVSDPPASSTNKRALQVALYLSDVNDVQQIIDDQFDKMGANVNIIRKGSQQAIGSVLFYTPTPPIRDMNVAEGAIVMSLGDADTGIQAQSYQCTESKVLTYANRNSYYNSQTQRYELEVAVAAVSAGSAGNTDSYTIKTISSGADADFLVENPNPVEFGEDIETNHDLASRLMLAYFADTGTEGGYAKTAVNVTGVHGVRVEKAGDPLMIRDYDDIRKEHIGGKVDIYLQGELVKQINDKIAFSFASNTGGESGEQFTVISAVSFQFKSENPRVTSHTPIFEVSKVINVTRSSAEYDLGGMIIIGDGDTIDLNETLSKNALIGLASADIIKVDYKYRSSDTFILQTQPVREIVTVTGQLSGLLTTDNYELVKLQDPLEEGESTIAKDSLRIIYANGLPVTDFQTITDEMHALVQGVPEELNFIGVDPESIVITDTNKTVTYVKDVDYTITTGTDTLPTTVTMIQTGSIVSGQNVYISYIAIENFTITYSTNSLLQTVQTSVEKMKHACADAIVKGAIKNSVDFIVTIIPKATVNSTEQLTSKIVTAVSNYIAQLGVGVSLTQAQVVHIIQGIPDVDYVVVPFIKMVKKDGSLIIRDDIGNPTFQIFNQGLAVSYTTTIPVLTYKTIDKGGPENLFRGVFENSLPLVLQDDPLAVSDGPGRAYIQADGKIVVSTKDGSLPDTKKYQVAYYVYGETGAKDINTASVEYLNVGTFSITYDTPRRITKNSL